MGNVSTYRNEINLEDSTIEDEETSQILENLKSKIENKADIKSVKISGSSISFVYAIDGNIKFDCELDAKKTKDLLIIDGEISQEWTKSAQFAICATFGCAVLFLMVSQNKADSDDVKNLLDSALRDIEIGA